MADKGEFVVPGIGGPPIPDILYFGRESGKWPIVVFENDYHAIPWMKNSPPGVKRYLFRVDMTEVDVVQLGVLPAIDARLIELRPSDEDIAGVLDPSAEGHWEVCSFHTGRPTVECPEGPWLFPSHAAANTPNRHDHWIEEL